MLLWFIGLFFYIGHPQPLQLNWARVYCGCQTGQTHVAVHPGRVVKEPERQPYIHWTTCYDYRGDVDYRRVFLQERVPECRDTHASSSHERSSEPMPTRSADLGKHNVYTHFPKDRNCEICQRTPCRRRIGGAVPRAESFGDLKTAVHKVLNENCESRHNRRCAIVEQDLATQWIQSFPCKTKTSQETQRSLQKFLEAG